MASPFRIDMPRELLNHIANSGKISRERLVQMLGVSDPHKFAGFLITISKCAAGSGIEAPIERTSERANSNGRRTYHYKIRENIKSEVKTALSK